jgi:hypothetical protein
LNHVIAEVHYKIRQHEKKHYHTAKYFEGRCAYDEKNMVSYETPLDSMSHNWVSCLVAMSWGQNGPGTKWFCGKNIPAMMDNIFLLFFTMDQIWQFWQILSCNDDFQHGQPYAMTYTTLCTGSSRPAVWVKLLLGKWLEQGPLSPHNKVSENLMPLQVSKSCVCPCFK